MKSRLVILASLMLLCISAAAQDFSVASFRALPNDVSAFINPVHDLNGDGCALIKVEADDDFAFSTPLGIIKRIDKTGEIWLYLPAKSKKITIKHPEWGVLRDYMFDTRLESHVTYEMRLDQPLKIRETAIPEPIIITQVDTLVITHVDTLVVAPVKPVIPVKFMALPTLGFGGKSRTLTGGIFLACMKRHGAFVHLSTDFGHTGELSGSCDRYGAIDGRTPFYSPGTYHSCYMANAGAIHRLSGSVAVFEGLGYSSNTIAWQLAGSEGGQRVKNSWYSDRGISFEAGAVYSYRRLSVAASVVSVKGRQWFGTLGIGINIDLKRKKSSHAD